MPRFFFLIIFSLSYITGHSQNEIPVTQFDSSVHKKIYRITFSNYQTIELISHTDQNYSGTIRNAVWKINRNGDKQRLKYKIYDIAKSDVDTLFQNLPKENIETLPTCEKVQGCTIGMDGLSISFDIITSDFKNSYWYWEPENDRYQNENIQEIKSVRNILTLLKSRIEVKKIFEQFKDSLPEGFYSYSGIIMHKID